jgi:hypothetical protein
MSETLSPESGLLCGCFGKGWYFDAVRIVNSAMRFYRNEHVDVTVVFTRE